MIDNNTKENIIGAFENIFAGLANLDFAGGDGSLGNEIPDLMNQTNQLLNNIQHYAESKGIDMNS
jgi:hypothetical protein